MIHREFRGFFKGFLPDVRIEKRAERVMAEMLKKGSAVVNQFCSTLTEKIGAYRMFANENFTSENLIEAVRNECKNKQGAAHLLCINDTTEINYTAHIERIGTKDLDIGPVGRDDNAGVFCHPMLVVDADEQIPIGFSSIQIWNRSWDKIGKRERKYNQQPIEEKESYRWIQTPKETQALLTETPMLTVVGDRESDIYEEFATVPDERTHLLIRNSRNRVLYGSDKKLWETLDQSQVRGEYNLSIRNNKKRKNRVAKMSLKYEKVKIQRPRTRSMTAYPKYIELWVIEAKELEETVPQGEEPVLWRLLTTHEVDSADIALDCLTWYAQRWFIEELFRVIKSKGMNIESSQLETGKGLKKQLVMTLQVALEIMTLKLAYDNNHKAKAGLVFTQAQIQFLEMLCPTLEGNTQKQKNPFRKETLAFCTWTIARLSGWSGYASQSPPGYISIKRGFDIFIDQFKGFEIAMQHAQKNVYKG